MDATLPDDFLLPQRGDRKERLEKHVSVFGGGGVQFKYPAGVVLSICEGGVIIWQAF